jgi:hypothetical protein
VIELQYGDNILCCVELGVHTGTGTSLASSGRESGVDRALAMHCIRVRAAERGPSEPRQERARALLLFDSLRAVRLMRGERPCGPKGAVLIDMGLAQAS